jgi:hypothetical protein
MFLTPNLVMGVTIMAVGIVLLLDTIGVRDAASLMKYWPAVIVLFGASLVAQAFKPVDPAAGKRGSGGVPCFFLFLLVVAMFSSFGVPSTAWTNVSGPRVTTTGIMGRAETENVRPDIRSGRVTAVMGRTSLDLRQVRLAPGEEVVVDVFVTMGRATVRIPDDWVVDASALPVMGSVDQERFTPIDPAETVAESENEPEALKESTERRLEAEAVGRESEATGRRVGEKPPRLRLRGFVLMGKVEITS